MIRLVLFDIDGTLIRTGGAGVRAFERTFAIEFGLPGVTRNVKFAGRTDPSIVRECFGLAAMPLTRASVERFFDTYVFLLQDTLEQSVGAACAGVVEFLQELQNLCHPPLIGLLTGNVRLGAEIKLRHYQLWDLFRVGAFGDDHEDRNCLARVGQERGQELLGRQLKGEEILVIGDTPMDVACGQSIGARVMAVGTGGYTCDELRVCKPTWVARTLADFRAKDICAGECGLDGAARPGVGSTEGRI